MERKSKESLAVQMKKHTNSSKKKEEDYVPYEGNFSTITSTGSTLVDLAISGKRRRGGGFPGGIVVVASGPSQSGKTALLSEIAGNIKRNGGENQFHDPEGRLDQEFARIFGMELDKENYHQPDTITELFEKARLWQPKKTITTINGIFGDSLAALSTKMEMESDDGDKMGGRRAKEFSEQFRKFCRQIKQLNYLMVCSNQLRENMDGNKYSPKYTEPGGQALKFYPSVRLRFSTPKNITKEITFKGKKIEKVIGIETEVQAIKTVDDPFRKAPLFIIYGYGIDDIRANLQYTKTYKGTSVYTVNGMKLDNSMEESIKMVEQRDLINELKEETIDLWEEIESKFVSERKPKR
jgi:protein RecA